MDRNVRSILNTAVAILLAISVVGCATVEPTVTAPVDADRYEIRVHTSIGGTTDPTGALLVGEADSLQVTILPDTGFLVDRVTVNGVPHDAIDSLNLESVNSDLDITVTFRPERVCLVLSVGGANGLSHIGAVEALVQLGGQRFDSVFGNSMGAVIGALYASAPDQPLGERYLQLMREYENATQKEANRSGAVGSVIGGVAAGILSGGLGVVLGAVAGNLIGKAATPLIDYERFTETLDSNLARASIENIPVEFATSYLRREGNGIELVVAREGNIADAVSKSINNPYIFEGTSLDYVDPGSDRMSSVPVEEAYFTFLPDRIVAVNTTDRPAVYSEGVECPVDEIVVDLPEEIDFGNALRGRDPDYRRLYEAGREAVVLHYIETGVLRDHE